jgi:hypothetical protein
MLRKRVLTGVTIVGAALLCSAAPSSAQTSLGTAASFGVLAGSTVTNTGSSVVAGNVGVSPGSAVIGFPPGTVTAPSTIHAADAVAAQAQVDLTTAYDAVAGTPTLVDLTGTDLGGLTLLPGVYGFSSSAQLTGTLRLDAQGNPDAVFLFKIGSSLTTATGSSVLVINGGSSCNVFWQVGSSATLGTTTTFAGNILALTSITLDTGVSVSGRALARNGAVTLAASNVTVCAPPGPVICPVVTLSPATLPSGQVGSAYSQVVTASGGTGPYTFAVSIGTLPPGLSLATGPSTFTIAGTPTTVGTFPFAITATDANGCPGTRLWVMVIAAAGCPPLTMSPSVLPGVFVGVPYSQTVLASGGTPPYTYAVSGALPPGLALNAATGEISGMPLSSGLFTFSITATDSRGCTGAVTFTMTVLRALSGIPTLSGWGLLVLATLTGLASAFLLKRAA